MLYQCFNVQNKSTHFISALKILGFAWIKDTPI